MTAGLLIFPGAQPSRSRSGSIISAELRWYVNETTTPATVYTDPSLTIPHPFPIVSDDAGRFPLIYADDADVFSCTWNTAAPDSQVQSYDNIGVSQAADVILLDEMNAVLADAMDLYESLDDVNAAVLEAQGYAAEAASAATGAPGTNSTSTTSLTVGTGAKSLTVDTGKLYVVGMSVTIASTASPSNAMSGQVLSYNPSTGALVVESVTYTGSGTYATWTISLSALNGTNPLLRSTRTANTVLGIGDARAWIDVTSGTFTQTLTAAGTLGSGWWVYYGNSGTGTVTIDPAGTETIGGATTLTINPNELYLVQCDGSNFNLIPIRKGGWTLYSTTTLTSQTQVTIALPQAAAQVRIELESVTLGSGVQIAGRVSADGVTFSSGTTTLTASIGTNFFGDIHVSGHQGRITRVVSSLTSTSPSNLEGQSTTLVPVAYLSTAGVNFIRLEQGGATTFTGGTVRAYWSY